MSLEDDHLNADITFFRNSTAGQSFKEEVVG
jgi:hypothetical protein